MGPVPDGNDTSAIQVTWLPAIKGHPGSAFYVQYRLKGDKTWHTTTVEEYEDRKLVYGLEKDALYEIRVVAIDGEHAQPSLIKMVDIGVTGLGRIFAGRPLLLARGRER
ncbi:hypothetical protein HPB48_021974 [Haemaphysalis longicornis]|uniref:Fibronectin type-III domain-containing protein n=1 Tax=Haemaphysalis longicornis TaxID=44386 RepID=A0A9J6FN95_HAELO|nr:hypothetical protein HPB48_021974 [Haemaphysalis longicornis]